MACPTCDHTMTKLYACYSWCPRCGTLAGMEQEQPEAPALVKRCRDFVKAIPETSRSEILKRWKQLGIAESINVPAKR